MAKDLFQEPGLTIAQVVTAIGELMDWDTTDGTTNNTRIEQAITAAGQAACGWNGRAWWWSKKTGTFRTKKWTIATVANSGAARSSDTTTITTTAAHGLGVGQYVVISDCSDSSFDGAFQIATVPSTTTFTIEQEEDDVAGATAGTGTVYVVSYPLRKVNGAVMEDLYAPVRVGIDSDWFLDSAGTKDDFDNWFLTTPGSVSKPHQYCLWEDLYAAYAATPVYTRELYIGLLPAPDLATRNIRVSYIVRHSKITDDDDGSEDAALIVPAEFHWPVYVEGAVFMLKKGTIDQSMMIESESFRTAMERMAAADPTGYDSSNTDDNFPDAQQGGWPHNRRVITTSDGYLIQNDPSLS